MARKKSTDELVGELTTKHSAEPIAGSSSLLSSGSTLLNLACSGSVRGAFHPGHTYLLVGDSGSGKSWSSLTCFAEAQLNPDFSDYRLVLDNPENSMKMDVAQYFGRKVADKLETRYSSTVEDFYYSVDDLAKEERPFLYVLDSMDALSADDEQETFQKAKEAKRKGKEAPGSYNTSKARMNSQGMRLLMDPLRTTGSILIVICQTRDNIGFGSQFSPKTRSGGKSLKFYTTLEIWTAVREQIKKTVQGKPRQLGILADFHVKKNRLTGRDRKVQVPIHHSSGIDDVGSMVDWLVDEGAWQEGTKGIKAEELSVELKRDALVRHVEQNDLEAQLREVVQARWDAIEEACKVVRKARYT